MAQGIFCGRHIPAHNGAIMTHAAITQQFKQPPTAKTKTFPNTLTAQVRDKTLLHGLLFFLMIQLLRIETDLET